MVRYAGMYGPDVTYLGVERCDLDDATGLRNADVVVIGAPYDAGTSYPSRCPIRSTSDPGHRLPAAPRLSSSPRPRPRPANAAVDRVRRLPGRPGAARHDPPHRRRAPVVGMDVVEVSPPFDTADVTALLANRVVLEMLSGIACRRQGGRWEDIPPTLLHGRMVGGVAE